MHEFKTALGTIWRLIRPYFATRDIGELTIPLVGRIRVQERWIGISFFVLLVAINLFQVGLNVRLSYFSRDLYNTLQNMDSEGFWHQLLFIFCPLAAVWVSVAILEIVIQYILHIRWRDWMTRRYINSWLDGSAHYRMQLAGNGTDNPDQRIAEDINLFAANTRVLSLSLLSQVATLVSFSAILWTLSADFTLPGTDIAAPGLLLWVAIIYAAVGTWLTHVIGKPLIGLNFAQQRYEADFRFSLARMREYGEQIALLSGETAEKERLGSRFRRIVDNYLAILSRQKKLTLFTASFFQANVVVPYLFTAPYLFLGKINLGQMMQTVGAFDRVQTALTFFISAYTSFADYKAVADRLSGFEDAIATARKQNNAKDGGRATQEGETAIQRLSSKSGIDIEGLQLLLPGGQPVIAVPQLMLRQGERTLLTGPSGSGKSTLFRAIAGIWPFGHGTIALPQGQSLLLLPQRPYIPVGTLASAVAYPALSDAYIPAAIAKALEDARLPQLVERLHEEGPWGQTLSLGEQQRLAIARALLAKPDWLLLDEATAALDEPTEEAIYTLLAERLPETTVVSIGHRSTLLAFHQRHISLGQDGLTDTALPGNTTRL